VPETLAALVAEKADGNPLFIEELAYAMRDGGLLVIEQGQCRLAANFPDWGQLGFPDTLHGVIASRIDRLGTPQQLAVKVASVIGHHFRFRALHDNYPLEGEKDRLHEHLDAVERAELIGLESLEPEASYLFRHVIMQQVAYELVPFQQRQQLHRAIAQWYEQCYAGNLAQHYPFLAHHWLHAGEPAMALDYLGRAGENSLHGGAYSEAAGFFAEALRLDEQSGGPRDRFRRARWQRQLGEAYLGLGRLPESRQNLEEALRGLDRAPPATWLRRQLFFLRHAVGQAWRRLWGRRGQVSGVRCQVSAVRCQGGPVAPGAPKTETDIEAARAYERLAEIYYLSGEAPKLLHALFATLSLSEQAGPSAELARAYASNSFTARLLRLHRLARAYGRDALATAQRIGDPMATAWVWGAAGISAIGMGEPAEARAALHNAIQIYRQLGDWQHWGECMAMLAQAAYTAGDFARGLEWWAEAYAMARSRGDRLQQAWGLNGQVEGLLRTGGPDELQQAMAFLHSAVELFTENIDKVSVLGSYGWLGVAHLRREDPQAAWEAAESGLRLIREIRAPTAYYMLSGCSNVAAAYLGLWEADWSGPAGGSAAFPVAERARAACRALARFARILPLGLPASRLAKGRLASLLKKPTAAMHAWKAALRAATRLHMPYEEAVAQFEIARHLPPQHPQRQVRLARACDLFTAAGARFDLARARQLLP
jgi:tetratricopeptide (TPR) repeat protein